MDNDTLFVIKQKRSRSENWLDEDKHLLIDLVRERVYDLENKSTDTGTNTRKLAAWTDLQGIFNKACKGGTRTVAQLKSQWKIIKMKVKHSKGSIFKNSNGSLPSIHLKNGNDISAWLPNDNFVDVNEMNSDNMSESNDREQSPQKFTVEFIDMEETKPDIASMKEVVENVAAAAAPEQPCDQEAQQFTPPKTFCTVKPPSQLKTPFKKIVAKESKKMSINYGAKIANTEMACRMELHQAQMDNEKRKARNLELKQVLIKAKIDYYRNKTLNEN